MREENRRQTMLLLENENQTTSSNKNTKCQQSRETRHYFSSNNVSENNRKINTCKAVGNVRLLSINSYRHASKDISKMQTLKELILNFAMNATLMNETNAK